MIILRLNELMTKKKKEQLNGIESRTWSGVEGKIITIQLDFVILKGQHKSNEKLLRSADDDNNNQ